VIPLISKLDVASQSAVKHGDPSFMRPYFEDLVNFSDEFNSECGFPESKYHLRNTNTRAVVEGGSCIDDLMQVVTAIKDIKLADGIISFVEAANTIMDIYPQLISDCKLSNIESGKVPPTTGNSEIEKLAKKEILKLEDQAEIDELDMKGSEKSDNDEKNNAYLDKATAESSVKSSSSSSSSSSSGDNQQDASGSKGVSGEHTGDSSEDSDYAEDDDYNAAITVDHDPMF